MGNNYLNIVLNLDKNYLIPAGVTMYSIIRNLSKTKIARFFLLVSDWNEECTKEISKLENCEINIIEMEKYIHYLNMVNRNSFKIEYLKSSFSSCYRLFIPKILPKDVKKVIYVDCDIVVDNDLSKIYDEMEDDKLLYAVSEYVTVSNKELFNYLISWDEFSKFNTNCEKYPYFNSGFFLMNVSLAKKLNIFEEFMEFLKIHPDCPYCDQDTLNAVCGQKYSEKMVYLSPEYNVSCDIENYNNISLFFKTGYNYNSLKKAFNNPIVYHFASVHKPWLCETTKHYKEVWYSYFNSSPFNYEEKNTYDYAEKYINNKNNQEIKYNIKTNMFKKLLSSFYNSRKKEWIYLFGFLPILMVKKDIRRSYLKIFLFGFIPLVKINKHKTKIYFLGIKAIVFKNSTFNLE